MTEQELREILGGPVEVPDIVEGKMAAACARLRAGERRPVRRRSLRTVLALAAAAAVLCAGAAAGYWITRMEVPVEENKPAVVEGLFGDSSRPTVEEQTRVEEDGTMSLNLPNRERVPVELPEALAVVGDYLPDTGYAWTVGDYTLTVEAYLLDQETGAGKIYFLLERPDGLEGVEIAPEDGEVWFNGEGIALTFRVGENERVGYRIYADQARTTDDTLAAVASFVIAGTEADWQAADGLTIGFHDLRLNQNSEKDVSLLATLELPGAESLPAVTAVNPDTGERAAVLSAIGIALDAEDIDEVDSVVLHYADGSSYVVRDEAHNLDNAEYALGCGGRPDMTLCLCFNRLVDPEQVVSVTVNGQNIPTV